MTTKAYINIPAGSDAIPFRSDKVLLPFTATIDMSSLDDSAYIAGEFQGMSYKLYFQHSDQIPVATFFYDYFNSGTIYINMTGHTVYGVKPAFMEAHQKLFFDDEKNFSLKAYPFYANSLEANYIDHGYMTATEYGDAFLYRMSVEAPIGYLFRTDDFIKVFTHEQELSFSAAAEDVSNVPFDLFSDFSGTPDPQLVGKFKELWPKTSGKENNFTSLKEITQEDYERVTLIRRITQIAEAQNTQDNQTYIQCKYYSYIGLEDDVISPEYKFANHITGFPSCSNPVISSGTSLQMCAHRAQRSSSCTVFEPRQETVTSVTITPNNSTRNINFSLTKSLTEKNIKVFVITNDTDDNVLGSMSIPPNISDIDAQLHANEVFDEYVSCYTEHTKSPTEETVNEAQVERKYISTLIEA